MLPVKELYAIYPSVIPADKKSEMTIAPIERAFMFFENEEYTVTIASVDSDEVDYHNLTFKTVLNLTAHGGVLKFDYTFAGEQEHLVILERGGVLVNKFFVYSLYEDLYNTRPMKGDFHSHSFRSDGQHDPAALAGHYREQGYDCLTLTDHNRFYPGFEIDEVYEGVNTGLLRIPGEEVHVPGSVVHIVNVGAKSSVAEKYCKHPEEHSAEIEEYEKKVPVEIPEGYIGRYARAMWATDKIHEAGGIAIFAHPFWRPKNLIHNVCGDLADRFLKSGMFDAFEIVGGIDNVANNRNVALWADARAEGYDIPVVSSSDGHSIENTTHFPYKFTIVFAKENSPSAVIEAIKNGKCAAIEATGKEDYTREYRAYGKLRFVSYAQYLVKYFFPKYARVCFGGGVAMRAYAIGDASKELVELQADLAERFRERFFGKREALCPDSNAIAFENKWREVQMDGPITKGSSIKGNPTRQL